ncbi:MAG: hypothetical protein ACRDRT_00065, partial [Pseudonocardiaceae bacterium]
MTTYYIRKTGNDGNSGLSAGAAWATLGKALGAAGIASGDTVYVGGGTYQEVVTPTLTSPTAETRIIGDVNGSKTADPGEVIWTAYLTNNKTAPSTAALLALNGRSYLTFEDFALVGGSNASGCVINASTTNSTHITFRRCVLIPGVRNTLVTYTGTAGIPSDWLMEGCVFIVPSGAISAVLVTLPTSGLGADYNSNFRITNSLLLGGTAGSLVQVTSTGALANFGGGVSVYNCLFGFSSVALRTMLTSLSTTFPCTLYNSVAFMLSTGCNAAVAGQIVEDYNLFYVSLVSHTNTTLGTNSKLYSGTYTYAPLLDFSQSLLHRLAGRGFWSPMSGSPLLGYGAQVGGPSVDILGVTRPAGGQSLLNSIGPYELKDTAVQDTTIVEAGGGTLSITGPGVHDLTIPVKTELTTITLRVRYDTTHGTTNKPQAQLLYGGGCGVSDQTVTAVAGID